MFIGKGLISILGCPKVDNLSNEVVRWERVNKYLSLDGVTAPLVALGSFITEPQFYKLAIKANNETAEKFQDWVTSEVLPSIRKHGAYMDVLTIQQIREYIPFVNETLWKQYLIEKPY